MVLGDGLAVTLCLAYGVWRASNEADDALTLDLRTATGLHPGADATHAAADRAARTDLAQVFRPTFIVTSLNPKGIVFFLAFIPQFVAADRPYWGQVTVYGLLFVGLGGGECAGLCILQRAACLCP